jgi:hypothetical protein
MIRRAFQASGNPGALTPSGVDGGTPYWLIKIIHLNKNKGFQQPLEALVH